MNNLKSHMKILLAAACMVVASGFTFATANWMAYCKDTGWAAEFETAEQCYAAVKDHHTETGFSAICRKL